MFPIKMNRETKTRRDVFGITKEREAEIVAAAGTEMMQRAVRVTSDAIEINISRLDTIEIASKHADTAEEFTMLAFYLEDKMNNLQKFGDDQGGGFLTRFLNSLKKDNDNE